jgi:DNA-binding transcriptional regulator YiaG
MSRRYTYEPMQPAELKLALKELGLSASAFARLSGTREDRFEQMLRGTRTIPQAIRLLAVLLKQPGALVLADIVTSSVVRDEQDDAAQADAA